MVPVDKLTAIIERFEYLEARMGEGLSGDEIARIGREYAGLRPVVAQIEDYFRLRNDIAEAEAMLSDPEMKELAEEELSALKARLPEAEQDMRLALLPRDEADARPAIIEIRPGTGGEEAALFAGDLLRMYQRYAERHGWVFELLAQQTTELGGIKEVVAHVKGEGVFARLKYESGVHRVDIQIDPSEIRIDTMRASGAGGQHVNTTDSAVRITHLPTGIVVTSSEKSQHRNREIAMQVLKTRLFDASRQAAHDARAADRKAQVGSGDRSERIRTYNFPQGRMTDHRIGLTLYRLAEIMQGDLDEVTDALIEDAQARQLAEIDG